MKLINTCLIIILAYASTKTFAIPCAEKLVPLSFTGITAYADCQDDSRLYFVPSELQIVEEIFSGKKSFIFKEHANGTADIYLRFRMFHNEGLILKALKEIKRTYPKNYRIMPFMVQELHFQGFDFPGIISQRLVQTGNLSSNYNVLRLRLNHEGTSYWKDIAHNGDQWLLSASLDFSFQISKEEEERTERQQLEVNFINFPSCALLGEACEEEESISGRLIKRGRIFGAYFFHSQYISCNDFLENKPFSIPSRTDLADPYLSHSEEELLYSWVLKSFDEEKKLEQEACYPTNESILGKRWLKNFIEDKGINCNNLWQWPWSKIKEYIGLASIYFQNGAEQSYREFAEKCQTGSGVDCDERNGPAWCHGNINDQNNLCYPSILFATNVSFVKGQCRIAIFEKSILDSYIYRNHISATLKQLRNAEFCLATKGESIMEEDYRTRITCKESQQS